MLNIYIEINYIKFFTKRCNIWLFGMKSKLFKKLNKNSLKRIIFWTRFNFSDMPKKNQDTSN